MEGRERKRGARQVNLYTIGYEGRTLDDFVSALQTAGVQLLADVREAPVSRKPGFSKSALEQALRASGIAYRHLRALGCPKPIRDQHKVDGDWQRYTREFMQHLDQQQGAVEELAALTQTQLTALLCFETDFDRCHRTYVARAVAARTSASIQHLTPTGPVADSALG